MFTTKKCTFANIKNLQHHYNHNYEKKTSTLSMLYYWVIDGFRPGISHNKHR